jgi:hypothetical protein
MIGLYELLGNPITFVPNSLSHQGPYTSNEDNIISVVFPFVIVWGGDICVFILLIYCTTNDSQCKYFLNILRWRSACQIKIIEHKPGCSVFVNLGQTTWVGCVCKYLLAYYNYIHLHFIWSILIKGVHDSRGRDRMVVGFTTTFAISVYHHWCEFESRSGRCVHYVIKFVSDLQQVGGFLRVPPTIKLSAKI